MPLTEDHQYTVTHTQFSEDLFTFFTPMNRNQNSIELSVNSFRFSKCPYPLINDHALLLNCDTYIYNDFNCKKWISCQILHEIDR